MQSGVSPSITAKGGGTSFVPQCPNQQWQTGDDCRDDDY